jgi:hypothetical protein
MVIEVAIAFSIASILIFTFGMLVINGNQLIYDSHSFQHSISSLAYGSHFIFCAATTHALKHFKLDKHATLNHSVKNYGKISIFIGRGAVRNLAIFHILVAAGPLSIGDIQRRLNKISGLEVTYYASLNKRVHALVRGGYIGEVTPAADKAFGFKVCRYEVRTKFYLAYYLKGKTPDEILSRLNDLNATAILSELINAYSTEV